LDFNILNSKWIPSDLSVSSFPNTGFKLIETQTYSIFRRSDDVQQCRSPLVPTQKLIPASQSPRRKHLDMTRNYQESDLPDFLQNSSLIPVSSGNDEFALSSHVQPPVPRPSLSQILRSKWMRNVITALFFIIAFLFLRSQGKKHNVLAHMGLGGPKCLLKEPISVPPVQQGDVDWSQFAYVQYVTNPDYLCNSVMLFESLHRLGSKADRLLMYPATYSLDKTSAYEGYLLLKARDEYNVTLVPVDIMSKNLSFSKSPTV